MQTIYQRLKPEFRNKLEEEKNLYPLIITELIDELKAKDLWSSLQAIQIFDLACFTGVNTTKLNTDDFFFGKKFLQCED